MKLGCGTVLFRKFDLERSLEAIRNVGFEYFETQAVGPWCPHVNVETDDPETLVRLKEKYGFKGITGLWTFGGNLIFNQQAVELGKLSIEWAAAAGIPVLHTGDGKKPADMTDEDAFMALSDNLGQLMEIARKNHVTLAIEPHGTFSLTGDGLKKMMALGTPDVLGVNYDACNVFRAGYVESHNGQSGYRTSGNGEDEFEVMKGIADRVVHFHVKDVNTSKKCVPLGEGLVKNKECVDYLKSIGYDGALSLETDGGDDFDQIVELAKKSFAYMKTLI